MTPYARLPAASRGVMQPWAATVLCPGRGFRPRQFEYHPTLPGVLLVLYQWDCAVVALRRGDPQAKRGFAHAPLVKGPNLLGQMLSGWFWANLLLLVVLWVVFMVFVYKPIRDSLLDYKWAAISFVITFVLKSQIANPKLYNKKASDGKLITSRAYYAFCCVAWTFYGFSTA